MATIADVLAVALGARARELAEAGAAPDPAVGRRITTRARDRSVVALLGVCAVASNALWWQPDDAPPLPPNPSPTVDAPLTVTVPLDGDQWDAELYASQLECGSEVLAPNPSEHGFTLETTVRTDPGGGDTGGSRIALATTYEGDAISDLVMDRVTTYVTRDGAVVGVAEALNTPYPNPGMRIETGDRVEGPTFTAGDLNTMYYLPCDQVDYGPDALVLAAGTYELVSVQRVRHTPESMALLALGGTSLVVAEASWGLAQAGSIDCERALAEWHELGYGYVPVQCDSVAARAAGIVVEGDQVTLPYEASEGPLDVDVTLVSEPVEWVVPEDITGRTLDWSLPEPTNTQTLECGTPVTWWSVQAIEGTSPAISVDELLAPGGADVALDSRVVSALNAGTIDLGAPDQVWIMRDTQVGRELVGTATASFTPNEVPIDRAVDYARSTLQLADFVPCAGQEAAEVTWNHPIWVLVATEATISGDGITDEADYVFIELGKDY